MGGDGHLELFADRGQEGLGAVAVEILHHAVVVHDLELIVGEDHGHEALIGLVAVHGQALGLGFGAAGLPIADGGGGAVVAVSDVEGLHAVEEVDQLVDHGLARDHPDRVADAVRRHHVIDRHLLADVVHDVVDVGHGAVGEEDRLSVGGLLGDVAGAVVLLVLAGELVALDGAVLILFHGAEAHQACLDMVAHALLVDVEAGGVLLEERAAGDEAAQVGDALGVDLVRVDIDAHEQVDLRTPHMEEGVGIALGQLGGLLGVHHVIGHRGHLSCKLGTRTVGAKRLQLGHDTCH